MPKEKKDKKNRAKPLSLYPLELEDALTEILKIPIDKSKKIPPVKHKKSLTKDK
ncbi:MAG: hypothetical protein KAU46_01740 [Candidatus Aminicenantes bacterium]|nr:hypothetical protein [Candidatus Aminicenantes bacterium]